MLDDHIEGALACIYEVKLPLLDDHIEVVLACIYEVKQDGRDVIPWTRGSLTEFNLIVIWSYVPELILVKIGLE